ncbi:hypothetical protein GPL17_24135 [Bradyrhizobium yuanmingense]|uniref:hypothetical protein n=1 Tax=Bradyrhizobium yuanmingense TaxID=108015 RepID=UPI0012F9D339|nr:hypothetical protein [Bradyrhizobium yuanmingense]MVT53563.1 hypothetical protein [Bradyrhizobium yuanmingense]
MTESSQLWGNESIPSPDNYSALRDWLTSKPWGWSTAIATRATLRFLPMASMSIMLPLFRVASISYFAARYRADFDASVAEAATAAIADARSIISPSDREIVGRPKNQATVAREIAASTIDAAYAVTHMHSHGFAAAAARAVSVISSTSALDAVRRDLWALSTEALTPTQLAAAPLWHAESIDDPLRTLEARLGRTVGSWELWISWYYHVHSGRIRGEAFDAAFTDLPGPLPWSGGGDPVSAEIHRRLDAIFRQQDALKGLPASQEEMLAQFAKIASPQPRLDRDGKLDAGPNRPYDVPSEEEDLITLPLRQMNLIKIILSDLPRNAPGHLRACLESYQQELKARGVQPILPLLKDDADIIAAAVRAPRAEDEWLEPGQRKAFERFDENHELFVRHFPLDVERENLYSQTGLDEENASGRALVEPFEKVAEAAQDAHRSGAVTDDFVTVIEKMTELARVLSTQPTTPVAPSRSAPDLKISPYDRVQPVTTKKRVLFGSLGFYAASLGIVSGLGKIATLDYAILAGRLKEAIEALSRFIR